MKAPIPLRAAATTFMPSTGIVMVVKLYGILGCDNEDVREGCSSSCSFRFRSLFMQPEIAWRASDAK